MCLVARGIAISALESAVVAVALGATWALAYNEISPGLAALLAAYAPLSGATFTGPVSAPDLTVNGNQALSISPVGNGTGSRARRGP